MTINFLGIFIVLCCKQFNDSDDLMMFYNFQVERKNNFFLINIFSFLKTESENVKLL